MEKKSLKKNTKTYLLPIEYKDYENDTRKT